MTLREKLERKAAEAVQDATKKQVELLLKYMESVGAHLELILEADREILNELREHHGKARIVFKDETQ